MAMRVVTRCALHWVRWVCALLAISGLGWADAQGYLGRQVCAGCHKEIAATQATTNMANTWQPLNTPLLPKNFSETYDEGPPPNIHYEVQRDGNAGKYQVTIPDRSPVEFPLEAIVGGKRHALTFIFRVPEIGGVKLSRAPLIESRYIHSTQENRLGLELGFPEDKPTGYETGFGRAIGPALEERCFRCHTAPRTWGGQVEVGVTCESCHGPGQKHLLALSKHSSDLGILNPAKLPVPEKMQTCLQCHGGAGYVEDALPANLLISDQASGMRNSECWRETAGQMTCTNCHNPHQDAPKAVVDERSVKTCLGCHSLAVKKHAAICPENRSNDCVGCHMPKKIEGVFHLADHWIRVHPEQNVRIEAKRNPAWRSMYVPNHLFLRMVVLDDREKAAAIHRQLVAGGSFFELARANSLDRTSGLNGGFLGDVEASKLDPAWSAVALNLEPGEMSNVLEANGKFVVIQRMPRNFKQDAEAKFDYAVQLRKSGKVPESIAALVDSLKVYPFFLRALTYLGITYSQGGNPKTGAGVLEIAEREYPRDEGTHFNLGVAYGALGETEKEIAEYQKTLAIDPDYFSAYLNWGGSLFAGGKYDEAIEMYRKGIAINPLSAPLHYSLGMALDRVDKKAEAATEIALAGKIDAKFEGH